MRTVLTVVVTTILTAILTILIIVWQDEELLFKLSPPSLFGDINYQTITIKNSGWEPAEHVVISISGRYFTKNEVKESPFFDEADNSKYVIGVYKRIRREEVVGIALAYKGEPIRADQVVIKSNRSIAAFVDDNRFEYPLLSFINGILAVVVMIVSIIWFGYRIYDRR